MAGKQQLKVLRGIISEFRRVQPGTARENATVAYILKQYRQNHVTDEKLCRGREELKHLADSYLCYLNSTRRKKELLAEFHGRGERSVEEAAGLVGLRLPNTVDPHKPTEGK